ncbi:MAG TPA: ribosome maturation factor RimM [Magnetospirillaceae bacterium]|jgi:16S rRNA processing protein RimM
MAERLLVGAVVGAQGLGGLLRVKSFTDNPADLAAYGPVDMEAANGTVTKVTLQVTGTAKGVVIVKASGVADRTQAEALKGARFFVDREALPEADDDEYYLEDLIGLTAELEDGTRYGRIKAVYDFGAGTILEIDTPDGSVMLSFSEEAVPEVDLEGKRVIVAPPAMSGDHDDMETESAEEDDEDEDDEDDDQEGDHVTRH